jgi:hypothetical protein
MSEFPLDSYAPYQDKLKEQKDELYKLDVNKPYRYVKNAQQRLNIHIPLAISQHSVYLPLFNKLYNAILHNDLDTLLQNLILRKHTIMGSLLYKQFVEAVKKAFPEVTFGQASPRIMVIESDGLVLLDSYRIISEEPLKNSNSYNNWLNTVLYKPGDPGYGKNINVNHANRIDVISSQLYDQGVGYATKWSNTVNNKQSYISVRTGMKLANLAVLRYSINSPE